MGQYGAVGGMGAQALGGIMQAGGAYSGGLAQQGYYNAAAQNALAQARLGEIAAERQVAYDNDAAVRQMQEISRSGRQTFGAQKAAMAASGMDLSSGSAQEVFLDGLRAENEDLSAVSYQAERSAYEARLQARLNSIDAQSQATQARIAGKSAKRAGVMSAAGTLLSTAGTVAGQWYQYKQMYGQNAPGKWTQRDGAEFADYLTDRANRSNPLRLTGKTGNKLSLI